MLEWTLANSRLPNVSYRRLQAGVARREKLPLGIASERLHPIFRAHVEWSQAETFLAELPGGRVWGRRGAVITNDNVLLGDVSREFGAYGGISDSRHPAFHQIALPRPIRIAGALGVAAAPGSRNYHHWMFDTLPRLHLLARHFGLDRLHSVVVDFENLPFQRESLAVLGIPEEWLMVPSGQWDFQAQAELLVVPSLASHLNTVSDWVATFLRDTFLPPVVDRARNGRKLYVSRRCAPSRRERNFEEVLSFLVARGFEEYLAEEHSIRSAARDFSEAEWIVGMHGSGLSNLVFASPGTRVIEFLPTHHVDPYYWLLSNHTGCSYSYVLADGAQPDAGKDLVRTKRDDDPVIPVKRLERTIQLLEHM